MAGALSPAAGVDYFGTPPTPLRRRAVSPDVVRDVDAPLVGVSRRRRGELRFFVPARRCWRASQLLPMLMSKHLEVQS